MRALVEDLDQDSRALRTLQAPEQVVFDPLSNEWAVSSAAFKPQSDGSISVDLEHVQRLDGLPLDFEYPRIPRAVGLVAQPLATLSHAGFATNHIPIDGNDYHGEARGKPSRSARIGLAATCEVIVPLDGDAARRHQDEKLARDAQRAIARGDAR